MNASNSISIVVPNLPESVTDATVAIWHKKIGDKIYKDEILLEIETDKIMLEIPSPNTGILESILEDDGAIVKSGQILGNINIKDNIVKNNDTTIQENIQIKKDISYTTEQHCDTQKKDKNILTPSIRKLITEYNLQPKDIQGSGIKGRLTRQDIETHIQEKNRKTNDFDNISNNINNNIKNNVSNNENNQREKRILMSRLRKSIAKRLLNVTNTTAMLTTFNEVNMQPIMMLRKKYGESFEKNHGVKLGFMSFYVKAVLKGLQCFPEINASIDGEEIVYYNYFDVSIAVSTTRGLVTPVLRDVETLNVSDIEKKIRFLADKGRNRKLTIADLQGGNFTITNGGVFGSLISTPIINPPQSAILGMHTIKERPVAVDGVVVVLPMMYLALSYDHRLVDGKDAIKFLVYIKELIEDPIRLFLDI